MVGGAKGTGGVDDNVNCQDNKKLDVNKEESGFGEVCVHYDLYLGGGL